MIVWLKNAAGLVALVYTEVSELHEISIQNFMLKLFLEGMSKNKKQQLKKK